MTPIRAQFRFLSENLRARQGVLFSSLYEGKFRVANTVEYVDEGRIEKRPDSLYLQYQWLSATPIQGRDDGYQLSLHRLVLHGFQLLGSRSYKAYEIQPLFCTKGKSVFTARELPDLMKDAEDKLGREGLAVAVQQPFLKYHYAKLATRTAIEKAKLTA